MGLRFASQESGECFFVTSSFRRWEHIGSIPGFYSAMGESLKFCLEKYDAKLAGYVFMPSHFHMTIFINGTHLSDLMRDFKKYIAQKVAGDMGIRGGIWMPRFDRVVIYTEQAMRRKLEYIHHNPVRAGLVESATDWEWSSANDYFTDRRGPLEITKSWS